MGGLVWGPKVDGSGGAPRGAHQSVIRFDGWFNEIKQLQPKMSKRITLCLRGDPALLAQKNILPDHVGRGARFIQGPLPLTSPCPPMPACSNRDCTHRFNNLLGIPSPPARQEGMNGTWPQLKPSLLAAQTARRGDPSTTPASGGDAAAAHRRCGHQTAHVGPAAGLAAQVLLVRLVPDEFLKSVSTTVTGVFMDGHGGLHRVGARRASKDSPADPLPNISA
jgi:hypothetical protein